MFVGPTGSGKTLGSLHLLHLLVQEKRIAFIDTERKRSMEYAGFVMRDGTVLDRYDVLLTQDYTPEWLIDAIKYVQSQPEYGGLIIDSFSHFWDGLNAVGQRGGYPAGWAKVDQFEQQIYGLLFNNKLVTWLNGRVKMDFEMTKDDNGRSIVKRMGLAPKLRNGMEYEFSFVGRFLDTDGNLIFDKASTIAPLKDGTFRYQMDVVAAYIKQWMSEGQVAPIRVVDGLIVPEEHIRFSDNVVKFIRNVTSVGGRPDEDAYHSAVLVIDSVLLPLGIKNPEQVAEGISDVWTQEMLSKLKALVTGEHKKLVAQRLEEMAKSF